MAGLAFREDFGTQGGALDLMGGETELLQRLAAAGEQAVFVPTARISHVVGPHQMKPEWLFQRAFRHGRTYRRLNVDMRRRASTSSRLWARFAVRWLAHALATRAGERARIEAGIKLFHTRGQLYEHALVRPATRRGAGLLLPRARARASS
jgi:GT2 family glycosyltransferase